MDGTLKEVEGSKEEGQDHRASQGIPGEKGQDG